MARRKYNHLRRVLSEIKIPEKTIEIMPIEFDTIEELLNLTSKSINKVNKRWQDKTIAIRSQLTLFD